MFLFLFINGKRDWNMDSLPFLLYSRLTQGEMIPTPRHGPRMGSDEEKDDE